MGRLVTLWEAIGLVPWINVKKFIPKNVFSNKFDIYYDGFWSDVKTLFTSPYVIPTQ